MAAVAKRKPTPNLHRRQSFGTVRERARVMKAARSHIRKKGYGETTGKSGDAPVMLDFGRTGLKRSAGLLTEEFIADLKGRKAQKVYTEMMRNHPLIGGAFWLLEMMCRRAKWSYKPTQENADNPEAQRLAKWFEGARTDIETPWSMIISEAFTFAARGFSLLEKSYKIRGGPEQSDPRLKSRFRDRMWGWRDFEPRSQDSVYEWNFDDKNNSDRLLGVTQQIEGGTAAGMYTIPIQKLLHFKLRSEKANPEGVGLLRAIYRAYFFSTREEELEAIGIDRGLTGFLVMRVPEQLISPTPPPQYAGQAANLWKQVGKFRTDEQTGFIFPGRFNSEGNETPWDLETLKIEGDVAGADPVIRRWHQLLMIGLLCQFLLLGTGETGSYSLSSDQTSLLANSIGSLLDIISEVFTEEARCLARLNGFDPALVPEMTHTDLEKQDIVKLTTAMSTAVNAGLLIPGEEAQQYLADEAQWRTKKRDTGSPSPQTEAPADVHAEEAADVGENVEACNAILDRVAQRKIPRESGIVQLITFFEMMPAQAEALMGEIGRTFFAQAPVAA